MKVTIDWIEGVNHTIPCNPKNYQKKTSRNVEYIVMHYTANKSDTAYANAKYFNTNVTKTSAHFFADEHNIYQSVKLHDIAWQCGAKKYVHKYCRNDNSIGIEMCTSGNYQIADATKNKAAGIVAYLFIQFGWSADEVDTRVLRHWDVTGKWCPAQMCGTGNADWLYFKNLVREKIAVATAPPVAPQVSALVFYAPFYANKYPDLKEAGITTDKALTEHFLMFGMKELRQGCEGFDPHVYKAYNEDLKVAFGDNNPLYYQHYVNYGHKENRVHV